MKLMIKQGSQRRSCDFAFKCIVCSVFRGTGNRGTF